MAAEPINVFVSYNLKDLQGFLRDFNIDKWFERLSSEVENLRPNRPPVELFGHDVLSKTATDAAMSSATLFVSMIGSNYFESSSTLKELELFESRNENRVIDQSILPAILPGANENKLLAVYGNIPTVRFLNSGSRFAGANIELLGAAIAEALNRLENPRSNETDTANQNSSEPSVWLCVYNPKKAKSFGERIIAGTREEWRINPFGHERLQSEMAVGDQVAIWRTMGGDAPSGIVATGVISDLSGLQVSSRREGRIEFEITEAFPENPFPREEFLELIDIADSSWPQAVSLKRLDDVERNAFLSLHLPPAPPTSDTEFSSDRPATTRDLLQRAPLAFTLAHKMNEIWGAQNSRGRGDKSDQAAFTLHIDAPWGGGKTSFANYISRFLNPRAYDLDPATLKDKKGSMFHNIDMDDESIWPSKYLARKWITVPFNAWRHQHVSPPWWDLYEIIRVKCLKTLPWYRYLYMWAAEGLWRAFSPQVVRLLVALVLFAIVLGGLIVWTPLLNLVTKNIAASALLTAITGATGLAILNSFRGGIQTLVMSAGESTDTDALGTSDPLRRFRDHFSAMIDEYEQPVLVIVDDLDRCDHEYVVELVRGMLTVFQSSRVMFLLLGDRDWIETAFSQAYKEMREAHSNDEVSFGGRFVEKAIQVSFVLPKADDEQRDQYVDSLLFNESKVHDTALGNQIVDEKVKELQQELSSEKDWKKRQSIIDVAQREIAQLDGESGDTFSVELTESAKTELENFYNTARVVTSAASQKEQEDETKHVLSGLKGYLPANPRRIKRIINMITIYQASAQTTFGTSVQSAEWHQLIPWILLMSEYPSQWRVLCAKPHLADLIIEDNDIAEDDPDHADYEKLQSENIAPLLKGLVFEERRVVIDSGAIEKLSTLTPSR